MTAEISASAKRTYQKQELIHQVEVNPLTVHVDDRGYLMEVLREYDPHFKRFGYMYVAGDNVRGVVRAFHKHLNMWEWFYCSSGSARYVLVDDRSESPTYKQANSIVIGQRNPCVLVVPPGVFHGWVSLEDNTQIVAVGSEPYNPKALDEVRVPADSFETQWEVQAR
jgi:dTDP-4-dehydrorhamnose 3,5-epimerase